MRSKARTAKKPGKSSQSVFMFQFRVPYPLSQSIGRGRINREGALDVRESRERRDKYSPKKQNAKICIRNKSCLSRTKTFDSLDPSPNVTHLN